MPQEIRLWAVLGHDELRQVDPADLDLESRLEAWLEKDVSILGEDLLVIGKQVATDFGGFIDLLCINPDGDLVILELKRDKTHREVTAQALDYASWVRDLSNERVQEIAAGYLGERGPLGEAFFSQFDQDLPDVVNESHRILIVASRVDGSTERIVRYLSDEHGVNVNVVTFQFFQPEGSAELLGRVFLLEPDQVDYRARSAGRSKRRALLTPEQLEEQAAANGIGPLYDHAVNALQAVFPTWNTSRSALRYKGIWKGSKKVMLNLLPGESSADDGLRYQVYSLRVAHHFRVEEEDVKTALPEGAEDYEYHSNADPEYCGYTGYFANHSDVDRFVGSLTGG